MKFAQPIAIVGIGGVFPGAPDLESFWKNIKQGISVSKEALKGEWALSAEDAYSPLPVRPDKACSSRGCFIDFPVLGLMDLKELGLDTRFVESLDPLYHVTLLAGVRAFKDAVTKGIDRKRFGIIIGNIALPSKKSSELSWEIVGRSFEEKVLGRKDASDFEKVEPLNRYVAGLPAGILAKALKLGAGAYALDAACSSSLYAIKIACDELLSGRADAMLSGGVSMADPLYTQMGFTQLKALSPDGVCSPFDSKANGLVVGNGAGFFILKRLDDALKAGDHIYAVIKGIGLSNDQKGNLLAPNAEGQLRAMQAAYGQAGWSPYDVDVIECHGTGTPVGDAVEFESLRKLWGDDGWKEGQCVIGSVKSNVGHLLTGAGGAALMKILLALKDETLPPTVNFSSPSPKLGLPGSPFKVLKKAEQWKRRGKDIPRRAAVSGFGFGGTNAHVLIEEWTGQKPEKGIQKNDSPIAIVGMDAHFGPWESLDAFRGRVLFGKNGEEPKPKKNWFGIEADYKGFGIDELSIPLGKFHIPPKELEETLIQQLLMLKVADGALEDAGKKKDGHIRSGCFMGIAFDLNATNFHIRWNIINRYVAWAKELGVEPTDEFLKSLRDASGPALNANRTMGAIGSITASRVAREFGFGGPSITVSSEESSGLSALQAAVSNLQQKEIDLALVGAVDLAGDIRLLIKTHYAKDTLFGEGAGALVLKRLEDAERDGDRIYAVIKEIGIENSGKQEVEIKNQEVGFAGAASSLASLIKAALSLYDEILPEKKQYWLRNRADGPRKTEISSTGIDGNHARVVLEEYGKAGKASPAGQPAFAVGEAIFAVEGADVAALLDGLNSLLLLASEFPDNNIEAIAQKWYQENPPSSGKQKAIAFVSKSKDELLKQINQAEKSLRETPDESLDGSERSLFPQLKQDCIFYSANPLGKEGKVAFVFSGSGNNYPRMGRQIGLTWPEVLRRQDAENKYLRKQMLPEHFWDNDSLEHIKDDLRAHIFGHVTFGTVMSDLLQSFKLRPEAVINYSLGESTSMVSMRIWKDRDFMMKRMGDSTLFTSDLAGPYNAVKKAWKLPKDAKVDWTVGVVDVPAEKVKESLKGRERVYLLIVNTPDECVVGGERKDVLKLVKDLGCTFLPVEQATIAHCDVVREVAKPYRDIHFSEVSPPEGVSFYSGSWGRKYEMTSDNAADAIVAHAVEGIDYPKTINAAYDDGVRIFIEIGPGASCTRLIRNILGDKPYSARSANHAGQDEVSSVLRLLAALIAERVPVDLSPLYSEHPPVLGKAPKSITLPVGGKPFVVPDLKPYKSPAKSEPETAAVPIAPFKPEIQVSPAPPDIPATAGPVLEGFETTQLLNAKAHETYLNFSQKTIEILTQNIALQKSLVEGSLSQVSLPKAEVKPPEEVLRSLNREQCMEFAIGKIGNVLGPKYAEIDKHPSRVRLPDDPMMFVDRITEIEGEPLSLTSGRVVTEHDVLHNGWYLDGGRIPTCDAVEAGQADLFLSGYLGIDYKTKGLAVYRLLDATVTFHDGLPKSGETIRYDIRILRFFQQGDTYLFRFEFDGTVDGKPVLTMRDGCAGFFTQEELDAGQGVVLTELAKKPMPKSLPDDWIELVPMRAESYSDEQINALRTGDLSSCFGPEFEGLNIQKPLTIPGDKMKMIDRIISIDPKGGRYGLGVILAEQDIHPDDWFLTCHFSDDNVMPGTLMYECCLHTLRAFLLRMGWIAPDDGNTVWEPIPGVASSLKCRGQVIASTKKAAYEIIIKELGYGPEPYAIADALMYADGKMVVEMNNMSIRLTGANKDQILALWKNKESKDIPKKPAIYDRDKILAFATGKPSDCFGEPFKIFDNRFIARLPRPPYSFISRITEVDTEICKMEAGGNAEGQYDVPENEWYFSSNRTDYMPFSILLEVALQVCGWYSSYMGSSRTSDGDLHYRNLGGSAILYRPVPKDAGMLTTKIKSTKVAQSVGMVIQNFDFDVICDGKSVYKGDTYFGFFSPEALANQIGITGAKIYIPTEAEIKRGKKIDYPTDVPFPDEKLRMIEHIDLFVPDGGPKGLGFIRGSLDVDPSAWFFKAHFYQDPVIPGSLGLESMLQLLKYAAYERWGKGEMVTVVPGIKHEWIYRGQVIQKNKKVVVDAWITSVDDEKRIMTADGFLSRDGLLIYEMRNFSIKMGDK